jgi:hypothetical protein
MFAALHPTLYLFSTSFARRVLQRLADKQLLDGTTKFTADKWEGLIRNLIQNGGDDFGVYSLLRKYYTGKTLEESLKIKISSLEESNLNNCDMKNLDCDMKNEAENEVEAEDGRANHLVNMTVACIPDQGSKYVRTEKKREEEERRGEMLFVP